MPQISLSQMTTAQLIEGYNALAPARGLPPIKRWRGDRIKLATEYALLRSRNPIKTPTEVKKASGTRRRAQPIFEASVEALTHVVRYDTDPKSGETISVGLSYADVRARVRAKFPKALVASGYLRVVLCRIREFGDVEIPQRRPRSQWPQPSKETLCRKKSQKPKKARRTARPSTKHCSKSIRSYRIAA